jgi:hypothetical protein
MTKLGMLCGAAGLTFAVFAACGSDDTAKKVEGEDAGAAGMEAGGNGPQQSGGSTNQPSAGQGGAPVVMAGGAAGEAALPEGGTGEGGAGGVAEMGGAGGALDCPAVPGAFTYSCGELRDLWNPTYDTAVRTFHFDTSALPFPIQEGLIEYFQYNEQGAQFCGSLMTQTAGSDVSAAITNALEIVRVRITAFTLLDVCGSSHTYDPLGAPECNDLEASGESGSLNLGCMIRLGACPDNCE